MKKIIASAYLIVLLVSCSTALKKMNKTLENVHSGMTVQEFKSVAVDATMVDMKENFSCYRLTKKAAKFGEPGGYAYENRFFYFKDDKLYRIDEGTRATDLKIEIENSVKGN